MFNDFKGWCESSIGSIIRGTNYKLAPASLVMVAPAFLVLMAPAFEVMLVPAFPIMLTRICDPCHNYYLE